MAPGALASALQSPCSTLTSVNSLATFVGPGYLPAEEAETSRGQVIPLIWNTDGQSQPQSADSEPSRPLCSYFFDH